jgi:hypothetical protein
MSNIKNPAAYQAATHNYIIANAMKTWRAANPRHAEIEEWLRSGRMFDDGDFIGFKENFCGSLCAAFERFGKLSEKQCAAVLRIIDTAAERRAERQVALDAQKALSAFVGTVGERTVFKLTVDKIVEVEVERFSYYDSNIMFIFLMRDEAGNRVIYKTKSPLCLHIGEHYLDIKAGDKIEIKATIKSHEEYKGEKQTIVQRAKVTAIHQKEEA